MMNVGVIGCGGWGVTVARRCSALFNLVGVYDKIHGVSEQAAHGLGVEWFGVVEDLIAKCDAIVIAIPPGDNRVDVLERCLEAGIKKIRIEKPLSVNVQEASEMILRAEESGADIYVGYTAMFNGGVEEIAMRAASLEGPFNGAFRRMSTVPARHESTSFGDLSPHDIATASRISGELPEVVVDSGKDWALIRFSEGSFFRFETSWDSLHKQRLSVVKRAGSVFVHDEALGHVMVISDDFIGVTTHPVGEALDRDLLMWESGAFWNELDMAIATMISDVTCAKHS